jgi:hypothetical protein
MLQIQSDAADTKDRERRLRIVELSETRRKLFCVACLFSFKKQHEDRKRLQVGEQTWHRRSDIKKLRERKIALMEFLQIGAAIVFGKEECRRLKRDFLIVNFVNCKAQFFALLI